MQNLSDDEKTCNICKGIYEEDTTLAGDPEIALRLPCSHVFGAECLGLLFLSRQEGGWEQQMCPICRRSVYEEGAQEPVVVTARDFGYHVISRAETQFDHDHKMGDGF